MGERFFGPPTPNDNLCIILDELLRGFEDGEITVEVEPPPLPFGPVAATPLFALLVESEYTESFE